MCHYTRCLVDATPHRSHPDPKSARRAVHMRAPTRSTSCRQSFLASADVCPPARYLVLLGHPSFHDSALCCHQEADVGFFPVKLILGVRIIRFVSLPKFSLLFICLLTPKIPKHIKICSLRFYLSMNLYGPTMYFFILAVKTGKII